MYNKRSLSPSNLLRTVLGNPVVSCAQGQRLMRHTIQSYSTWFEDPNPHIFPLFLLPQLSALLELGWMRECECHSVSTRRDGWPRWLNDRGPQTASARVPYVISGVTDKSSTGLHGEDIRHRIRSNLWQGPLDETAYSCKSACLPGVCTALALQASCAAQERGGCRLV